MMLNLIITLNKKNQLTDTSMKKIYSSLQLLFVFSLLTSAISLSSCSSDEKIQNEPVKREIADDAIKLLLGDQVFYSRATMNGVNKTLLEKGCPTKFNFSKGESKEELVLSLSDFSVGHMPFSISFKCVLKFMNLNSWEKKEHKGEGWVKFKGDNANITLNEKANSNQSLNNGGSVLGLLNVDTKEIEFTIDYNMMNVRTETFMQKIDKSRVQHYEEEFKKFEKELEQYKKEHGLS